MSEIPLCCCGCGETVHESSFHLCPVCNLKVYSGMCLFPESFGGFDEHRVCRKCVGDKNKFVECTKCSVRIYDFFEYEAFADGANSDYIESFKTRVCPTINTSKCAERASASLIGTDEGDVNKKTCECCKITVSAFQFCLLVQTSCLM